MASRSLSAPRTPTATSGPGRSPASDGRIRHSPRRLRLRTDRERQRGLRQEAVRLRARAVFGERPSPRPGVGIPFRPDAGSTAPARPGAPAPGAVGETAAAETQTATWAGEEAGDAEAEDAEAEDAEDVPTAASRAPAPGAAGDRSVAAVDPPDPPWLPGGAFAEADITPDRDVLGTDTAALRDEPVLGPAPDTACGATVEPVRAVGTWRARASGAVRDRMPLWMQSLQARCGLEARSMVALAVALVVAVLFAVQHFWAGRTQPVRAPDIVRAAPPEPWQDSRAPSAANSDPSPPSAVPAIVVDVAGKVRRPGLQHLPAGSRVADALEAAGGVRPGVPLDGLNRARLLADGEQLIVGEPPETGDMGAAGASGVPSGAGTSPGAPSSSTPISLNTATVEQLDALPGVGPVLAQHIVDYRTEHGGFHSIDELREVNGIGDRRFTDLQELVRL